MFHIAKLKVPFMPAAAHIATPKFDAFAADSITAASRPFAR